MIMYTSLIINNNLKLPTTYTYSNLIVDNDFIKNENNITICGHVFPIDISERRFLHSILDGFGQFWALKKIFPDIRPFYFWGSNDHSNMSNFVNTILEKINYDNEYTDIYIYKKIIFEKISFFNASQLSFIGGPRIFYKNFGYPKDDIYHKTVIEEAKNFLHSIFKINKKILKNKKICFKITKSILNDKDRFLDDEEINNLYNFFISKGYEIVDLENLSFEEQIKNVSSAEAIATYVGANSVHSLYAHQDCQFLLINLNMKYDFNHSRIVKNSINNFYLIFDNDDELNFNKKFSFDDFIIQFNKLKLI